MGLLAGAHYDPAALVNKATTAALAMTAVDTTNLRLTFVAPASGRVQVRIGCAVGGATTAPALLLGALEVSPSAGVVRGRMAPTLHWAGAQAATSHVRAETLALVTGLTPGATYVWDAAYGVELAVAASNIRYGGPNDATASTAWGGFAFEVYSA